MWASPELAPLAMAHRVLEPCRGWERPSDHVPLIVELEV
jgi:exodeoxyribonuclease-3